MLVVLDVRFSISLPRSLEMEESTLVKGACPAGEGTAAGNGVKRIAFAVAALGVGRLASEYSELLADVWVSEPAVLVSVTVTSCIETTKFFPLVLGRSFVLCCFL